jgi:outer membrane protein assembly factor BamD
MRGLAHFDQAPNWVERVFRVDLTERPPRDTLQAFSVFQELLRRFPESQYVADARERMIFLRNRLAAYENHVAEYYMRREAYVAAANRAKYTVEHYPGAPQIERALEIMVEAYETLGMTDLAADARRVLDATRSELAAAQ